MSINYLFDHSLKIIEIAGKDDNMKISAVEINEFRARSKFMLGEFHLPQVKTN